MLRYDELPEEERKLWHSHVYEVKSGMLIMPQPSTSITPSAAWETAETSEMEEVIGLYGKVYHFWQVDRGDKIPMGKPELMLSLTNDEKVDKAGAREKWKDRDERFGVSSKKKAEQRAHIPEPAIHPGKSSSRRYSKGNSASDWYRCCCVWDSDVLQMPIRLRKSSDVE